jgi:hypothetical protein
VLDEFTRTEEIELGGTDHPPIIATVRCFPVGDERTYRDDAAGAERELRPIWRDMNDERRTALVLLLQEALTEMAADVESWLEQSLGAGPHRSIGVSILFRLGSLDDRVLMQRASLEAERDARIEELKRICDDPVASPT